jgi:nicotinamide mononucleotide transporter
MAALEWLFDAQLRIGDQVVLWREIVGNLFGLASALGGMRRKVWAWPVGIVGNVLLFTVFLGAVFGTPNPVNLLGQAGRQVMFVAVSVYGWRRWREARHGGAPVVPTWASGRQRILLVVALVGGTALLTPVFRALGSYEPVWADAWIFVGSLLATYGMAKGWVEFWLIYYASAAMYVFYGAFTLTGFFVWMRARGTGSPAVETAFPDPRVVEAPADR